MCALLFIIDPRLILGWLLDHGCHMSSSLGISRALFGAPFYYNSHGRLDCSGRFMVSFLRLSSSTPKKWSHESHPNLRNHVTHRNSQLFPLALMRQVLLKPFSMHHSFFTNPEQLVRGFLLKGPTKTSKSFEGHFYSGVMSSAMINSSQSKVLTNRPSSILMPI